MSVVNLLMRIISIMVRNLLLDHNVKPILTNREWVSNKEIRDYYEDFDFKFACNMLSEGVSLDFMSNEDYKKAILECYRMALETVPMPSDKQEG